jgi:hypothetical protein
VGGGARGKIYRVRIITALKGEDIHRILDADQAQQKTTEPCDSVVFYNIRFGYWLAIA